MTRGELMVLSWGKGPCQDLARNADNGVDDSLFVIPILAQSPAHMTPSQPQTRHRSFCLSRWEEVSSENELWDVDDLSWLWICSRLATNGFRCLTLTNWRARQSRAWCWSYLRTINWNKSDKTVIVDIKCADQVTTCDGWGWPNKRRSGLTIFIMRLCWTKSKNENNFAFFRWQGPDTGSWHWHQMSSESWNRLVLMSLVL